MHARCLIAAALIAPAWACSSVQAVPVEFLAQPQAKPTVVELKGQYGVRVAVQNPRLSGDTVYGTAPGGTREVVVPLQGIEQITTKRFSRARTALLIGGGAALAGMATFFIVVSGKSPPELDCGIDNPVDPADRDRCGV
jgi:hypothetical protein